MGINRSCNAGSTLLAVLAAGILMMTGCGGGNAALGPSVGTGGGAAGPTTTFTGQVADGIIEGATVQAYYDALLTMAIPGASAVTDANGNYTMTFPASLVASGATVFFKTTGGTDLSTHQSPAPSQTGVTVLPAGSSAGTFTASFSPLSSLIQQIMALDPTATVDSAIEQIAGLFTQSQSRVNINPSIVSTGLVNTLSQILEKSNLNLTQLAQNIVTQNGLSADVGQLQNAASQVDSTIHVQLPPFFVAVKLTLGSEPLPLNGPVTMAPGLDTVVVTPQHSVSGGSVPTISIDFTNLTSFTADATFHGVFHMTVKSRNTQAQLDLKVDQVQAVRMGQNAGTFSIPAGANLVASGNFADGSPAPAVVYTNPSVEAGLDLFNTSVIDANTNRLSFFSANILASIRTHLNLGTSNHPISLLETPGNYDIFFTFTGFPIHAGTPQQGIAEIEMSNLTVTQ